MRAFVSGAALAITEIRNVASLRNNIGHRSSPTPLFSIAEREKSGSNLLERLKRIYRFNEKKKKNNENNIDCSLQNNALKKRREKKL